MLLESILERSLSRYPAPDEVEFLIGIDRPWSAKFNIKERLELFVALYPSVRERASRSGITSKKDILISLWRLWLPLALDLKDREKPFIQGILAPQGTGKTTLTLVLGTILDYFGIKNASLSLDDLYKTYAERMELQKTDPRLIWRGPPGTHDVKLGLETIDSILNEQYPILLPRFDKSLHRGQGDRIAPERKESIDILLFEGWCLGFVPVNPSRFDNTLPYIETPEDIRFALDCNERLRDYLPLWQKIDRLLILRPPDYRLSLEWRKAAEPVGGMSRSQIREFVKYFWKSLHPEIFATSLIDRPKIVVEIEDDRGIGNIHEEDQAGLEA